MLAILSSFISLLFGDRPSIKRKIAFRLVNDLSDQWEKKYRLHFIGISEASDQGKYKTLGIELNCRRILTKDEGRTLVIQCAEAALQAFNSCPSFREHMANYPFTADNIIINIFPQPPNISRLYYPNISVFSLHRSKLEYLTNSPDNEYKYYTQEEESFNEAKRIVEQQRRANHDMLQ